MQTPSEHLGKSSSDSDPTVVALNHNSSSHSKPESASDRRLVRFTIGIVVALLAGFLVVHYLRAAEEGELARATAQENAEPSAVDTITVAAAPSSLSLSLPGETAAWYGSTIYARVNGYVAKWNVDIGDPVKKGDILATIETPDLDSQLTGAEAKFRASTATVAARQADADFGQTTYERWKGSPKGVVSEQEREDKKAGYASAVAQLDEAKAQASLDQADVDRYTTLTQFKQVTAPFDGIITKRQLDIGDLVTAGSTASTSPLFNIAQEDRIRVFIDVPQGVANDVRVDQSVRITASNVSDRKFDGKVTRTANAIDPLSRTLHVEVDIPNPDHLLVPGMYVNADFSVGSEAKVQVPASALIFRSSGPQVAVVDKDNHIHFTNVIIARDDGNAIEIGAGLTVGDRIALNISNQIADGAIVDAHDSTEGTQNGAMPKR